MPGHLGRKKRSCLDAAPRRTARMRPAPPPAECYATSPQAPVGWPDLQPLGRPHGLPVHVTWCIDDGYHTTPTNPPNTKSYVTCFAAELSRLLWRVSTLIWVDDAPQVSRQCEVDGEQVSMECYAVLVCNGDYDLPAPQSAHADRTQARCRIPECCPTVSLRPQSLSPSIHKGPPLPSCGL